MLSTMPLGGAEGEGAARHLWFSGELCLLDLSDSDGVSVATSHVRDDVLWFGGHRLAVG